MISKISRKCKSSW